MKVGTILVVDDELNVRKALKRALSPKFSTVIVAENAEEAEQLMNRHRIDVAIIDEKMPGRTGLELLATIRDKYPHMQCILLTGWAPYHKMVAAVKDKRICTFIRKPWDDADLVSRVEKLMDATAARAILKTHGADDTTSEHISAE